MEDKSYFIDSVKKLNIDLTNRMIEQFEKYYKLLIEWNSKFNLTAITDEKEIIIKHFVDSLLIVKSYDISGVKNILDLGTGAGFPGIPLKIVYPDLKLVLLDSVNKKINFLKEVSNKLSLEDVICLHGRAEDYGRNIQYREKFDLVVSRAVSNLSALSEYCLPFVNVNGYFIAYKSVEYKDELKSATQAIKTLSGNISKIDSIRLPNSDIIRTFIIVNKINKLSDKYPRKAGLPTKKPL